jgi:hypothetical protein
LGRSLWQGAGRLHGSRDRVARPISGDNPKAKDTVAQLIDRIGFDSVDAGTIAESWRQQPGSPAYCTNPTKEELELWLKTVDRSSLTTNPRLPRKMRYMLRSSRPARARPTRQRAWGRHCDAGFRNYPLARCGPDLRDGHVNRVASSGRPQPATGGRYPGRETPSRFIFHRNVERFIPRRAAAPFGPLSTQPVSRRAPRMCSRSASASVLEG